MNDEEDTCEVRTRLIGETLKAYRTRQTPDDQSVWIPKSIVPYIRRGEGVMPDVVMKVESWFLDKEENKHIRISD